jgi:tetratricopeptide (TPR) repeat protein
LNPSNLQLRQTRGKLLADQAKYAEARDDFNAILEELPAAKDILRARAVLNWQNLKEFNAALADFQRYAELWPQDAESHRCIGAILFGQAKFAEALGALQKAIDLKPGYPDAIWVRAQILQAQGGFEEALAEVDPLIAKLPDGPPETLIVRAGIYERMGKLDEATGDYARIIELKPKEPEAYACLARLYEKRGQREKAVACLDRLVSAAPESKWAFIRRAEFRRDSGNLEGAEADCKQAAKLAPGWSVPKLVEASVTAARGNASAAVAQAEAALSKSPSDDGHVLYAAACVWSLAAKAAKESNEGARYKKKAADFLTKTLNVGFHDLIYPEHNRIAEEPALARIRELPTVRDLLKAHGLLPSQK